MINILLKSFNKRKINYNKLGNLIYILIKQDKKAIIKNFNCNKKFITYEHWSIFLILYKNNSYSKLYI